MSTTTPPTKPEELDITFDAPITTDATSGWTSIAMAGSSVMFGTGKPIKIAGTIDGHPFHATMLPVGGGTHMIPLKAAIRKAIRNGVGDHATVHLRQRLVSASHHAFGQTADALRPHHAVHLNRKGPMTP